MAAMFKMAILGLVHDHIWNYLQSVREIADAEITCAADVNQPLLERAKHVLNLTSDSLYTDYREILEAAGIALETNREVPLTLETGEL